LVKKEITVSPPPLSVPKINADGVGNPKKSGNCEILVFDMHHKSREDHLYIPMVNGYQGRRGGEGEGGRGRGGGIFPSRDNTAIFAKGEVTL
jgi:hypothetical protein